MSKTYEVHVFDRDYTVFVEDRVITTIYVQVISKRGEKTASRSKLIFQKGGSPTYGELPVARCADVAACVLDPKYARSVNALVNRRRDAAWALQVSAMAPDMLDALKALVVAGGYDEVLKAMDQARAIIARAEGL